MSDKLKEIQKELYIARKIGLDNKMYYCVMYKGNVALKCKYKHDAKFKIDNYTKYPFTV